MKKIFAVLITLGLLLAPISVAQAQSNNEVLINLNFADDTVYVNASDNIVLYHGWAACTSGYIMLYLSAVQTELRINNVLVSRADGKDQYWGPISEIGGDWSICIGGNQKTARAIYWYYPLGMLEPGVHVVQFNYWLERPIIDGGDYDGDGRPDKIDSLRDRTITIIVSE